MDIDRLKEKVWDHYRDFGRDLPWRHDPLPYQVVVSEIMLQQTQVARVLERYPRWMDRFPDFSVLASAPVADVLEEWQGMGYNRRALWLQRIAIRVTEEFSGKQPQTPVELVTFPGIGANTAGSITAFAFNAPVVFIETNIRRVFIHELFDDAVLVDDKELLPLIGQALDTESPREWYYALMDYGSHLGRTIPNPNRRSRQYLVQSKLEGSRRQLRGEVLRRLMQGSQTEAQLRSSTGDVSLDDPRLAEVLSAMSAEGFLAQEAGRYSLPQ